MSTQTKALEDQETREAARQAALAAREKVRQARYTQAQQSTYAKALRDKVTYQALRTVGEPSMEPTTTIGLCEGLSLEIDTRSQGLLQVCRERDLSVEIKPVVRQEGVYYLPVNLKHRFQALSCCAYVQVATGNIGPERNEVVSYYYVISEVISWIYMRWTARGSLLENCHSTYVRSQMIEFFKYADQGMPYWAAHEEYYRAAIARAETVLPDLSELVEDFTPDEPRNQ